MPPQQTPSRNEIWKMFDRISPTYDRVNRIMTFGLDQYWRNQMCRYLPQKSGLYLLDCATGTCDQIACFFERSRRVEKIVGIDLAADMVALGEKKLSEKPYFRSVQLRVASALDIPFPDNTFDCVSISFGIRNVTDVSKAVHEFFRVLKPGGRVLILEGTIPEQRLLRALHLFYLRTFLPKIGGWISHQPDAYKYLNQTIETFPQGKSFLKFLEQVGFQDTGYHPLTGGAVTIYQGDKARA